MISWPLAADYSMMLQNPQIAFKAAELRQSQIARDQHNQPLGLSGSFAVVYRATLPDGRNVAVRAFTSPNTERTQRYNIISGYLRRSRLSNYLVDFEYTERGIRASDGKFYPLLTMDWVTGDTLYDWVNRQCESKNGAHLRRVTDRWAELVHHMEDARIAHGDLQHGNVLVDGQLGLKLVDYDCMCVPDLVGRRNLEIGVEPYQHPARNSDTQLSLQLDRFSSIFIYVAMRALSAEPRLWWEFVSRDSYDKLLFRKGDLESPTTSALRQSLAKSRDTEVLRLFDSLTQLYRVDIAQVPSLQEFLFSFDTVRSLLSKQQFDEAVELVSRHKKLNSVPTDLRQPLQDAQRRVDCRQLVAKHIATGDEQAMARDYRPDLLQDYPAAKAVADVAVHAAKVVQVLSQMDVARRTNRVRELVEIWDRHASMLSKRKCGSTLNTEVESWRTRNQLADRVKAILATNNGDSGLEDLWRKLRGLGGHPEVDNKAQDVESLVKRSKAWQKFLAIPREASQECDERRDASWQESMFAHWHVAESRRPEMEAGRHRLDVVRRIERLATSPPTLDVEDQILQLVKSLPDNYDNRMSERIRIAKLRLHVVQRIRDLVKAKAGEIPIAEAWDELRRVGGESIMSAKAKRRLDLARQRAPLLAQLKKLPVKACTAQHDAAILGIWKPELLDDCDEADLWQRVYRDALARRDCLLRLDKAISVEDDQTICQLSSHPCLSHYELPKTTREAVTAATVRFGKVTELTRSLETDDRNSFCASFDATLIRKYRDRFRSSQEQLVAWTKMEVLTIRHIGLKVPVAISSIVPLDNQGGGFRLRWIWPGPQFTTNCIIGLTYGTPPERSNPQQLKLLFRDVVSRSMYESAGGCRIIHPDRAHLGCQVFVWAIVDLGLVELASEPLFLGRPEIGVRRG